MREQDEDAALIARAWARVKANAAEQARRLLQDEQDRLAAALEVEPPKVPIASKKKDRAEMMQRLHAGEHVKVLARDFGISEQRVRQIAQAEGWSKADTDRVHRLRAERANAARRNRRNRDSPLTEAQKIRLMRDHAIAEAHGRGWTPRELAAQMNMTVASIYAALARQRRMGKAAGEPVIALAPDIREG